MIVVKNESINKTNYIDQTYSFIFKKGEFA
jgi:hypothetical protein